MQFYFQFLLKKNYYYYLKNLHFIVGQKCSKIDHCIHKKKQLLLAFERPIVFRSDFFSLPILNINFGTARFHAYIEEQQQSVLTPRRTISPQPRFEVSSTPLREVMSWTPNSDEDGGAGISTAAGSKLPKRFAKSAKTSREALRSPLQEVKRPSTTSEGKTSIHNFSRGAST